uniref:OTU domain-containing protein 6B n=1 Tax=Caligus clemensi TaxID=344056 RepID=C1C1D6_CALCM|nr:OTU domain-containing protein 6B [Caligus clemensi]
MSDSEECREENPLEVIKSRHRKEKKELQGQIQGLKKSSTKGDKKKRKEVLEEIASLEKNLELRHEKELKDVPQTSTKKAEDKSEEIGSSLPQAPHRLSKAQKRRNEKERKERDREIEIRLAGERNKFGVRQVEMDKLGSIMKERGLLLKEMPADGDCMFSAIADQVPGQTVKSLRGSAALRLRETADDILPFMSNKEGEPMSMEEFQDYCSRLESRSDVWGGQIELNALATVLKKQIEVIQAEGAIVTLGEEFGDRITLAYYRHMYGLGEHYNSVKKIVE